MRLHSASRSGTNSTISSVSVGLHIDIDQPVFQPRIWYSSTLTTRQPPPVAPEEGDAGVSAAATWNVTAMADERARNPQRRGVASRLGNGQTVQRDSSFGRARVGNR